MGEKQADQDDYEGVEYLYGIEQYGPGIQDLGRVLAREGRLIRPAAPGAAVPARGLVEARPSQDPGAVFGRSVSVRYRYCECAAAAKGLEGGGHSRKE
jgi:hypothetical protein